MAETWSIFGSTWSCVPWMQIAEIRFHSGFSRAATRAEGLWDRGTLQRRAFERRPDYFELARVPMSELPCHLALLIYEATKALENRKQIGDVDVSAFRARFARFSRPERAGDLICSGENALLLAHSRFSRGFIEGKACGIMRPDARIDIPRSGNVILLCGNGNAFGRIVNCRNRIGIFRGVDVNSMCRVGNSHAGNEKWPQTTANRWHDSNHSSAPARQKPR